MLLLGIEQSPATSFENQVELVELEHTRFLNSKKKKRDAYHTWNEKNSQHTDPNWQLASCSCRCHVQCSNFRATWAASRDLLSTREPPSNVRETTRPCRSIYSYHGLRKRRPVANGIRTITYAKSRVCWAKRRCELQYLKSLLSGGKHKTIKTLCRSITKTTNETYDSKKWNTTAQLESLQIFRNMHSFNGNTHTQRSHN